MLLSTLTFLFLSDFNHDFVNHNFKGNVHCYLKDDPSDILEGIGLSFKDIGFGRDIHTIEGDFVTHVFNENIILKELETKEFILGYWTMDSKLGLSNIDGDGFTFLLGAIKKLKNCSFDGFSDTEKDIFISYFGSYDENISYYISADDDFLVASNADKFNDIKIIYRLKSSELVINAWIKKGLIRLSE